jgi:putative hydrolase of the HAD superfamily
MIKAIVFDFDGTVIDTETAWYVAFRDAYRKYDVELTLKQYSECIGTSLHSFNPYDYLVTHLHLPIDLDEFRKSVKEYHTKLMETENVRPGIVDFLKLAKQKELKVGLASSSVSTWVNSFLSKLDLLSYFDCVRTSDHVSHVKPDPQLYLQTLDCLGVKQHEGIAIEDSPNGAKAAVAAGLYCVVVPNSITKYLQFGPVHQRAYSLSDLDFDGLL